MTCHRIVLRVLILFCIIPTFLQNFYSANTRTISKIIIKTRDGIKISGIFLPAANSSKFTLILTHGLGSTKEEWLKFCTELSLAGYGYFIYDIRGHGESIHDVKGNTINYKHFFNLGNSNDWLRTLNDIEEIINHLSKYSIKKEKIILAGASLGANISFICAGKNKNIPGIILLSAGLNYAGITTENFAKQFNERKVFIMVSEKDVYSYQSSLTLEKTLKENSAETVFIKLKNEKHGVDMLDEKNMKIIINWINNLTVKGEIKG